MSTQQPPQDLSDALPASSPTSPTSLEASPAVTEEQPKERGAARLWVKDHWGAITRSIATAAIMGMLTMAGTWFDEFTTIWKLPTRVITLEEEKAAIDPARLKQLETTIQKLEDAQMEQSQALNDVKGKLVLIESDLPHLQEDMKEVKGDVKYLVRSRTP